LKTRNKGGLYPAQCQPDPTITVYPYSPRALRVARRS
jgi:hypothetical protein